MFWQCEITVHVETFLGQPLKCSKVFFTSSFCFFFCNKEKFGFSVIYYCFVVTFLKVFFVILLIILFEVFDQDDTQCSQHDIFFNKGRLEILSFELIYSNRISTESVFLKK